MILIIDGYNLLKSVYRQKLINEDTIKTFINKLERYSNIKGHDIILVLDGGTFSWPEYSFNSYKVISVNSGYRQDADNYIIDYVSDNRNKDILVVSSDNKISDHVQSLNIPSINSDVFYIVLNESLKNKDKTFNINKSNTIKKMNYIDNPELDRLMENSIIINKDDKNDINDNLCDNIMSRRLKYLSKMDKRLLNILKKL